MQKTKKTIKFFIPIFFTVLLSYGLIYAWDGLQVSTGDTLTADKWNELVNISEAGKGLYSMQSFVTAGSHTRTKPAGINRIKIYVTGAGGGGGSHNEDDAQGGGGAGGTSIKILDVSSISSVNLVIGTGGTGACGNGNNGGTGGTASSFGSYATGNGGDKPITWAIGGLGGSATNGDLNLIGSDGIGGNIDGSGNEESGGNGGSSYWGGGGRGGSYWGICKDGVQGSGGGGTHANTSNCGCNGGNGIIVIEEYK